LKKSQKVCFNQKYPQHLTFAFRAKMKAVWNFNPDREMTEALELLDSRDFNSNINNRNTRGVAIRRRDAAIELTELAEEIQ
jgi:hypothetical protein